jgi:FtsP/CotA-like multicopper oxidase with cupredoxin domain
MQSEAVSNSPHPAYGFALTGDGAATSAAKLSVPGPTLVLQRGTPVEITLVNRPAGRDRDSLARNRARQLLRRCARVEWRWESGDSAHQARRHVCRAVHPSARGNVHLSHAPPRSPARVGYVRALLVLEAGETFDPAVDHVVVIGQDGPGIDAPTILNGSRYQRFSWKAGARHRLRFINITPGDVFVTSLARADGPVQWRLLTKDAAPVPPDEATPEPATQTIGAGETFDFEFDAPPGRYSLWINVRTPAGRWAVQGYVALK